MKCSLKRKSQKRKEVNILMLKKTITTAIVTGSLLLSTISPALADTALVGNGAGSDNRASVTSSNDTTVVQDNTAHVDNSVDSHLNTGGNSANNLTGGSAAILTGDAVAGTSINNQLNQNQASLTGNGGLGNGTTVISGNGAWSDNSANANSSNATNLFQNNQANVNNHVNTNANTGFNHADNATGGDVAIQSGTAQAWTNLNTMANSNWANVQGFGNGFGGSANVINGNGAFSQSDLNARNNNGVTAVQNNNAWVDNSVRGNLNTGRNSANNGTNSSASIYTGNANANTNVNNLLNSNIAQLENLGGNGSLNKILGNGAFSNNNLTDTSNGNVSDFATNNADVHNRVSPRLSTGKNELNNGTGGLFFFSDPSVRTGGAYQSSNVQTTSNSNSLGEMNFGGQNFSFEFNPAGLLSGFLH
jgi:hypothetical protein